jgi:hypothetical protein
LDRLGKLCRDDVNLHVHRGQAAFGTLCLPTGPAACVGLVQQQPTVGPAQKQWETSLDAFTAALSMASRMPLGRLANKLEYTAARCLLEAAQQLQLPLWVRRPLLARPAARLPADSPFGRWVLCQVCVWAQYCETIPYAAVTQTLQTCQGACVCARVRVCGIIRPPLAFIVAAASMH